MRILLVCAGGMSSAIAAKSLRETAQKDGLEFEVNEVSTTAFPDEVGKDYDLALVAPQVRHRFDTFKADADKANVPILLIAPKGYSPIGGKFLLEQIKKEASDLFN